MFGYNETSRSLFMSSSSSNSKINLIDYKATSRAASFGLEYNGLIEILFMTRVEWIDLGRASAIHLEYIKGELIPAS